MDEDTDGLESLSLRASELTLPPRRKWWLIGQSLRSTILSLSISVALFILWLITALRDKSVDWLDWLALVLYAVVIVGTVPSLVHFIRLRRIGDENQTSRD